MRLLRRTPKRGRRLAARLGCCELCVRAYLLLWHSKGSFVCPDLSIIHKTAATFAFLLVKTRENTAESVPVVKFSSLRYHLLKQGRLLGEISESAIIFPFNISKPSIVLADCSREICAIFTHGVVDQDHRPKYFFLYIPFPGGTIFFPKKILYKPSET